MISISILTFPCSEGILKILCDLSLAIFNDFQIANWYEDELKNSLTHQYLNPKEPLFPLFTGNPSFPNAIT